jgi:hypothetical protein
MKKLVILTGAGISAESGIRKVKVIKEPATIGFEILTKRLLELN